MTSTKGHLIACCCNDCLDRQVADVYDTFGEAAGLKQRLDNELFIRKKAAFWDAFMERWQTPHDMTPMEDAKAMVNRVSRLVAEYEAGSSPRTDPPLALITIPSEPDAIGPRLRMLHDQVIALTGVAPFPPGPDLGPEGRNYDGRPYNVEPNHPLFIACDCQPAGMVHSNHRSHCIKISGAGELCTCRCHPENR